jgi:hypothetical protein
MVQRVTFTRQHPAQSPIPEAPPLRGQLPKALPQWEHGGGTERAEDLEALREELHRLSKQIEEAEH